MLAQARPLCTPHGRWQLCLCACSPAASARPCALSRAVPQASSRVPRIAFCWSSENLEASVFFILGRDLAAQTFRAPRARTVASAPAIGLMMLMGTTSALAVVSWPPEPRATTTPRIASCPSSARLAIAPPPGMSPESRALRISTMWRTCMSPDWPE